MRRAFRDIARVAPRRNGYHPIVAKERARTIDWSSATIKERELRVGLSGAPTKRWSEHFRGVLALIGRHPDGWGAVRLSSRAIIVADVEPGAERDLRHFLESVVLEANADAQPDDAAQRGDASEDDDMAATFRSFAAASNQPRAPTDIAACAAAQRVAIAQRTQTGVARRST